MYMYMYSTYYKPMGDLPYTSSEQGGLTCIIHTELIRICSAQFRNCAAQFVDFPVKIGLYMGDRRLFPEANGIS